MSKTMLRMLSITLFTISLSEDCQSAMLLMIVFANDFPSQSTALISSQHFILYSVDMSSISDITKTKTIIVFSGKG